MKFGDGAQIHPRLTETTLYKATDNCFTMAKARQIILAVAPPGFQRSLSACYNYTQNFKSGTYEARRHHEGKGVNANISLHKIPRIGSVKSVVNVHYAAKGVALVLEETMNQQNESLVDAKEAKGIVCADIDPVQTMGKSWRRINRLDHQWNQSRENAVTPMTHLFLKTKEEILVADLGGENYTALTHSGKVVTLVNPSFFEPETA